MYQSISLRNRKTVLAMCLLVYRRDHRGHPRRIRVEVVMAAVEGLVGATTIRKGGSFG
jgi:hypothetical protein